jgi:hypothetical protein
VRYAVIAAFLALAAVSPGHAENTPVPVAMPEPPHGIPFQSPTLMAELVQMHQVLLQIYTEQVQTNVLLRTMQSPAPTARSP